ncbi:AAEL004481-PA [Aedes aegypti]|uniref:AAEL004481-PA n=1 Tax=Aedes aegypti TaxID=7159 RepID=Q17CR9_AEDAE|nr:AAEL004481-PA [Aedes aegypti]
MGHDRTCCTSQLLLRLPYQWSEILSSGKILRIFCEINWPIAVNSTWQQKYGVWFTTVLERKLFGC